MASAVQIVHIPDDGIDTCIPGSPFSVLTLIEVRNRMIEKAVSGAALSVTPSQVAADLGLAEAQVCAALAYYQTNQAAFDEELVRRQAASDTALSALFAANGSDNRLSDIVGSWPGTETDEEVDAALEHMS